MSDPAVPTPPRDVVAEVIDNGPVSGQQILVVGLCLLLNMLDGFDITAMAIVAGNVSEELQLTADRLGLIFSFALAGMMLGAMVQLQDSKNPNLVLVSQQGNQNTTDIDQKGNIKKDRKAV